MTGRRLATGALSHGHHNFVFPIELKTIKCTRFDHFFVSADLTTGKRRKESIENIDSVTMHLSFKY